jgi:hypothetical protein
MATDREVALPVTVCCVDRLKSQSEADSSDSRRCPNLMWEEMRELSDHPMN